LLDILFDAFQIKEEGRKKERKYVGCVYEGPYYIAHTHVVHVVH
jgi:hypothetical protein